MSEIEWVGGHEPRRFRVIPGYGEGRVWGVGRWVFHTSPEWTSDVELANVLIKNEGLDGATDLFRAVASLLLEIDLPRSLTIGAVARDGVLLVVAGSGLARAQVLTGVESLTGSAVALWANRVVLDPTVVIGGNPEFDSQHEHPKVDLVQGMVLGGGFALLPPGRSLRDELMSVEQRAAESPIDASPIVQGQIAAPVAAETLIPAPGPVAPAENDPSPSGSDAMDLHEPEEAAQPSPAATAGIFGVEPESFGVSDDAWTPSSTVTLDAARLELPELGAPVNGAGLVDRPTGAAARDESPEPGETDAAAGANDLAGVRCANGHLNSPAWSVCLWCGETLSNGEWVSGTRPPLGSFRFDHGLEVPADRSYLIGRRPGTESWEGRDAVEPLVVEDPRGAVSKDHFELIVRDWEVRVIDRKSRNGTVVRRPDGAEVKLKPGIPVSLAHADEVVFADRRVVFMAPSPLGS